jgi:hypothetical protein
MDENLQLDELALNYVRKLSGEIGARPAGSPAEKQACQFVSDELRSFGYNPVQSEFKFAPLPVFYPLFFLCGTILIASSWAARYLPELSIWTPILFSFIPLINPWLWNLRKKSQISANLVAYSEPASDKPTLIFCAHLDTSRALAIHGKLPLWFSANSMNLLQRTAFLIAAISFFLLLGWEIPTWLLWAVGVLGSAVGGGLICIEILNQFMHGGRYSPGAVDNASGAAVCLVLAKHFAKNPVKRLRLGFLFTGAEETGLHGAEAFARQMQEQPGVKGVINLDMVGAGENLCVVTKAGVFLAQFTDPQLNEQLKGIVPGLKPIQYILRRGDFIPFLQNKISATSLETRGSRQAEMVYHTRNDQPDYVDRWTLDMVLKALIGVVQTIPYSNWVLSKKD